MHLCACAASQADQARGARAEHERCQRALANAATRALALRQIRQALSVCQRPISKLGHRALDIRGPLRPPAAGHQSAGHRLWRLEAVDLHRATLTPRYSRAAHLKHDRNIGFVENRSCPGRYITDDRMKDAAWNEPAG